jgi:phage protein U
MHASARPTPNNEERSTMASEVMMQLGSFAFTIATAAFDSLKRSTAYNWASQSRFGKGPFRQYVGKGDDSITLDGTIFTERAGLQQINNLRSLAGQEKPHVLVDQFGHNLGYWCIESIDETQTNFFADGSPRKQAFSMKLVAYGEDI